MAEDVGIFITEPGTDVVGAPKNKVLMNTSTPFLKLDTQNSEAFKTITLIMTNDPPEPVGPASHAYTQITKFRHGYTYKPSVEVLYYVTNSPGLALYTEVYGQDIITLSQMTAFDAAQLYASADATWVYLYIDKYKFPGFGANNVLTGTNIDITIHVFVEDVGV